LSKPEEAKRLLKFAQEDAKTRWLIYEQLANMDYSQMAEAAD